jgi:hypothetical protein
MLFSLENFRSILPQGWTAEVVKDESDRHVFWIRAEKSGCEPFMWGYDDRESHQPKQREVEGHFRQFIQSQSLAVAQ